MAEEGNNLSVAERMKQFNSATQRRDVQPEVKKPPPAKKPAPTVTAPKPKPRKPKPSELKPPVGTQSSPPVVSPKSKGNVHEFKNELRKKLEVTAGDAGNTTDSSPTKRRPPMELPDPNAKDTSVELYEQPISQKTKPAPRKDVNANEPKPPALPEGLPRRQDEVTVLNMPKGSKLDLRGVDIDKLNQPYHGRILPRQEPKPKQIEDLSNLAIGTPHWQDEVVEHLEYDADKAIEAKEEKDKKAGWWLPPSLGRPRQSKKIKRVIKKVEDTSDDSSTPTNIGLLDLDIADGNTDLERLVSSHSLPRIVQIEENFSTPDCCLSLEKNKELMLHFSAPMFRVHAVDPDGKELWMPVHSKLRFERLPVDPRLDEKCFVGTTAVCDSRPLPVAVRVTAAHCHGDPAQMAEVDDIVQISHVEMGKSDEGVPQKVVIGKIGEQFVHLGEDLNYAEYTTMLSEEFLPMSELIKFDFPQRVRVVDTEAQIRVPKKERHLKLLSYDKETHVICTQPNEKRVISIPLTCPVKLAPITGDWVKCRQSLPAIYPLVNYTWHVYDLGRPDLKEDYRQIAQPMPAIIKEWVQSYEGKAISVDVAERHVQSLKDQITDLKRKSQFQRERLRDRSPAPDPLPPRPEGRGQEPPPRPQKSDDLKKKLTHAKKQSPSLKRSVSDGGAMRPTAVKSAEDSDGSDYESIDEEGYERPKDLQQKMNKGVEQTLIELKKILEKKEEDVRNAKIKEDHLQKRVGLLEKEKQDLETKNGQYASQIRQLQMEIDHALKRQDEDIYDSIDPPPVPSNDIYNSPVDLKGVNNMTTEAVCDLLRELNLSQYVDHFSTEQVDGALLESLEEDILMEDLGMKRLHARKLKLAVDKRSNPAAPR